MSAVRAVQPEIGCSAGMPQGEGEGGEGDGGEGRGEGAAGGGAGMPQMCHAQW